jgi:hypothetical protein
LGRQPGTAAQYSSTPTHGVSVRKPARYSPTRAPARLNALNLRLARTVSRRKLETRWRFPRALIESIAASLNETDSATCYCTGARLALMVTPELTITFFSQGK